MGFSRERARQVERDALASLRSPGDPRPPGGPRRGLMRRFAITHDYLCPFARNAAEVVVRALEDGAAGQGEFRAFSLSRSTWTRVSASLAARRRAALGRARPPVGPGRPRRAARAVPRRPPGPVRRPPRPGPRPERPRGAGRRGGLGKRRPRRGREAGGRRPARGRLATDHTWAVDTSRVFGVPTFVTGSRSVFVRLMDRPATPPPPAHPGAGAGMVEDGPTSASSRPPSSPLEASLQARAGRSGRAPRAARKAAATWPACSSAPRT